MESKIYFKKTVFRGNKPLLIINDEYIFYFIIQYKKSKIEKYQYKDMKTKYKCIAYIKIKEDKITASNNIHNHPNHQIDIMKEQDKKDIKSIIRNAVDPFSINLQENSENLFS